jgi:hypothetical protein
MLFLARTTTVTRRLQRRTACFSLKDTNSTKNDVSNSSSIVISIFIAMVMLFVAVA